MIMINPSKCKNCKRELQPKDILINVVDNKLVRTCIYCGNVAEVEGAEIKEK